MLRTEFQTVTVDGFTELLSRLETVERIELANALPVDHERYFVIMSVTTSGPLEADALEGGSGLRVIDHQPLAKVEDTYQVLAGIDLEAVCILTTLTSHDALPHRIVWYDSRVEVVISTRDWTHLKDVATEIEERHGPIELIGTTQTESLGFALGTDKLKHGVFGTMSDEQLEALNVAYDMGYFRVPQEVTSQEVADELGISRSTLSERLRRAENNLCELLFGEQ